MAGHGFPERVIVEADPEPAPGDVPTYREDGTVEWAPAGGAGGGGGGGYVPGSDRLYMHASYTTFDPDSNSITFDWRGIVGDGTPGVGTANGPEAVRVAVLGAPIFDLQHLADTGELQFALDGVFNVKMHLPGGVTDVIAAPTPAAYGVRLGLVPFNGGVDGDDSALAGAGAAASVNYTWAHRAGHVVKLRLSTADGSGNPPFGAVTCRADLQVVRLSDLVPPENEFVDYLYLSEWLA